MAKDPVCNREVDEATAQYRSSYEGKTYYFTSAECRNEFDGNPGKFAAAETVSSYGSALRESAGQARQKMQEKKEQMKGRVQDQAKSMITERKGKAVERLGTVAEALRSTAQQLHQREQSTVARYADSAAQGVDKVSHYLDERNAEQLISDLERLIRRQPGLFLGGALATGFILARFFKSSPMAARKRWEGRALPSESEGEAAG